MRKAISKALVRVAISGSPTAASRSRLSRAIVSSDSRCKARSTPRGFDRYSTASPLVRSWTPSYKVGRKPLPQFELPPLGPFLPELNTTKPGSSCDSLPNPYTAQEPKLGRPNNCEPVFIMIWPGAWLNASVTSERTMAMSSTTSPSLGSSSESSAPHWPCRLKANLGPSNFELGVMNAAR